MGGAGTQLASDAMNIIIVSCVLTKVLTQFVYLGFIYLLPANIKHSGIIGVLSLHPVVYKRPGYEATACFRFDRNLYCLWASCH